MPLPPDYYNRPKPKTTPPASTGGGSSQAPAPKVLTAPEVISGQAGQQIEQNAKRGFWSFGGEGLREIFTGSQPGWDQMSAVDKQAEIFAGAGRLAVDNIAAAPKVIAKAVPGVFVAGVEAVENVAHWADKTAASVGLGPRLFNDEAKNRDFTLPLVGKVTGYRTPYREAVEAAGGEEFASFGDKFLAALQATGKVAGDIAITTSLVNSIRSSFSESLVKTPGVKPGTGPDIRPKIQTRTSKIKQKVSSAPSTFKQNPNDSWIRAVIDGQKTNSFFRIRPLGDGTAEYTLYETKPALFKNPFNKGVTPTETPFGPALPSKTGIVRYDESVTKLTKPEDIPLTAFKNPKPGYEMVGKEFTGGGKYGEVTYESPVQVDAGRKHPELGNRPNYFSHDRYSDLPDGTTRRSLETQSDLFQNNNLKNETGLWHKMEATDNAISFGERLGKAEVDRLAQERAKEIASLKPYEKDFKSQLLTFNKEIERAGADGMTKYQWPAGSTAMKIEGLGETHSFSVNDRTMELKPSMLKVGMEVNQGAHIDPWIVTDVLGEGRFKAISRSSLLNDLKLDPNTVSGYSTNKILELFKEQSKNRGLDDVPLSDVSETFDVSGKVDNTQFVFRLNETAKVKEAKRLGLNPTKIKTKEGEFWQIDVPQSTPKTTDGIKFTSQKAKNQDIYNRVQAGQDIPSVMQPARLGYENALIESGQMENIMSIAKTRRFDPSMVNAMAQAMFGGKSVPDLTQSQAFDLSETIRRHDQPEEALPGDSDIWKIRPFVQPAKDLFSSIQDDPKFGYPLMDKLYNPMENGYRWADNWRNDLIKQFDKVFGKHRSLQENQLLFDYVENTDRITSNPALTPEAKTELIKIGEWVKKYLEEAKIEDGIVSNKYAGGYATHVPLRGGTYMRLLTDELPSTMKQMFEFERQGTEELLEDNLLAVLGIHAKARSLKKFVAPNWEEAMKTIESIPADSPNIKNAATKYMKARAGYQGEMEAALSRWGAKLSQKSPIFKKLAGPQILTQTFKTIISGLYAATTGIPRLIPPLVNTLQIFTHGWASFDDKYFIQGIKNAATKAGREEFARSGFSADVGAPYGGEIATRARAGAVSRGMQKVEDFNRATLAPQSWADNGTRAAVYHMAKSEFEDNWAQFNQGKITQQEFENNINLDGYSPSIQNIVLGKLKQNTPESVSEAMQTLIRERIDDTIFPMRKASGTQLHQTMASSTAGMFTKWPTHNANTLWNWAKRGQWQKILKWYAATVTLKRTFEEAYGIDMSRYLGRGSFPTLSVGPALNAIFQGFEAINKVIDSNGQIVEDNSQSLIQSLKLVGGAAFGLGEQRLSEFYRSVKAAEAGYRQGDERLQNPTGDPLRRWPILTKKGNTARVWVTFNDLLIYTFGGTPTSLSEVSQQSQDQLKDLDKKARQMDEIESYQNFGNDKKADELIEKYQLRAEWGDKMKHNSLQTNQKIFQRLPKDLKEKWGPVLFPVDKE